MVSCRYLVIQTRWAFDLFSAQSWIRTGYILDIDSLMFSFDITHLSYSYRVFAGNLQKRN